MANEIKKRNVVVTGDVTIDWNIARIRHIETVMTTWNPDDRIRASCQRGGAALLGDLIEAVAAGLAAKNLASVDLRKIAIPSALVAPGDESYHHSYALWSIFKQNEKTGGASSAWRVAEFIGMDRSPQGWTAAKQLTGTDSTSIDFLIVDDADLGYREHAELWSGLLEKAGKETWVLLKMSRPVAAGALWDELHRRLADRLIVVMTVDDLRRSEVQISRGLSWERTAQDLIWEMVHNPRINALSDCARVVVSFDTAGAFLLENRRGTLFFDPHSSEGSWAVDFPGGMIGYNSCLSAGIARQIMLSPKTPDLAAGIQSGLAAGRRLHQEGYGYRNLKTPEPRLNFPVALVSAELENDPSLFAMVPVQDPLRYLKQAAEPKLSSSAPFWNVLQDLHSDDLDEVARRIVLYGADESLRDVPLGQFGDLLTVDRREIESFRSIRALISEYCSQKRPKNPVSIAVFGAPGSGKSFGVNEVVKTILPGIVKKLEFNLSQFAGPKSLQDAFHQVRDVGLAGNMPLVFFDEFDSPLEGKPLGWLRHFLAPMQDGVFQQGQINHPIGPAVFVFSGGTCESMESFIRDMTAEEFRKVKGPDFVSRIKGYVNILGPNPVGGESRRDPYFVLRRAVLLRSLIARSAPQLLEKKNGRDVVRIDPGVLNAFLFVSRFKHGARSLEAVLGMSQLAGKVVYERSCLPPEAQLDLHVNGLEFLSMVQQIVLSPELLEKLADAAHGIYCETRRAEGFVLGPEKNDEKKTNPLLVPYAELPEWAKESNRVTVRTIPQKLSAVGYVMIPARSNQAALEFPADDVDRLARIEHQIWMEAKLAARFKGGKSSDSDPRRNEYLVSWEELPEDIKQIDRDLVRGIPRILLRAGYALIKIKI